MDKKLNISIVCGLIVSAFLTLLSLGLAGYGVVIRDFGAAAYCLFPAFCGISIFFMLLGDVIAEKETRKKMNKTNILSGEK